MRMVPSGMLYFGWVDLDQTKSTDGPFLDMKKLKDNIIAFWELIIWVIQKSYVYK